MGYQQHNPFVGMQKHISEVIPSYPSYAQPDLNRQFPFVATLDLPDLNQLTNDPIHYLP